MNKNDIISKIKEQAYEQFARDHQEELSYVDDAGNELPF